ncbi:permease [Adhaeribacter aerolatus]|uniref:Permease n=1 Tax=Adhaeribacter aerolatus TaxID=670289 RepID=A0A512AUD6_9BACT|nr:DMT family transporter [Adhaeribacter aerolatus]GEO03332.1 permease [Adhaeribacter aerolatus]
MSFLNVLTQSRLLRYLRLNTALLTWLLVGMLSVMWGTSYILIKRSLTVFTPFELAALRTTIASVVFLPAALSSLKQVNRTEWKYLLAMGCLAILFPAFLFPLAQTHLASTLTGIINSLTGLFTLLVGALLFRQKITALKIGGILLGMAGTAILILSGRQDQITSNAFYGLFVVLATICNALNANIVKRYLQHINALKMSALGLFTVGPVAFIYLCTTAAPAKILYTTAGLHGLGYVSILALVSTSLGFILYNKLIQISSPLFVSVITYLIPIVALLWGLQDGEQITTFHYVGMATILAGVFIVNKSE